MQRYFNATLRAHTRSHMSRPRPIIPRSKVGSVESFSEMATADRHVGIITTDCDLRAFGHDSPLLINTKHHGCFAPAVTDGFEFLLIVSPAEQVQTALERFTLKVSSNTKRENRDVELITHVA